MRNTISQKDVGLRAVNSVAKARLTQVRVPEHKMERVAVMLVVAQCVYVTYVTSCISMGHTMLRSALSNNDPNALRRHHTRLHRAEPARPRLYRPICRSVST